MAFQIVLVLPKAFAAVHDMAELAADSMVVVPVLGKEALFLVAFAVAALEIVA